MRVPRKSSVLLALLIFLISFAIVEVYAHSYVHNLPVISKEAAFSMVPFYYNGSYEFSYNAHGCIVRWLAVWQIKKPLSSINWGYVYLFKIGQNSSLLIQTLDITPMVLRETTNNSYFNAWLEEAIQFDNYIVVRIGYDMGKIGIYEVDFGLVIKIYAKTLFGYLPLEETRVPIEETLYYGPNN